MSYKNNINTNLLFYEIIIWGPFWFDKNYFVGKIWYQLNTLLYIDDICSFQHPIAAWLPLILSDALRHLYQRSLLEESAEILTIVKKVWSQLLRKSPLEHLLSQATPWLGVWLSQCMQPSNIPFDPTYMLAARHRVRVCIEA